jgi:hypothetical protein
MFHDLRDTAPAPYLKHPVAGAAGGGAVVHGGGRADIGRIDDDAGLFPDIAHQGRGYIFPRAVQVPADQMPGRAVANGDQVDVERLGVPLAAGMRPLTGPAARRRRPATVPRPGVRRQHGVGRTGTGYLVAGRGEAQRHPAVPAAAVQNPGGRGREPGEKSAFHQVVT